ncbi:unnamed protein product [Rhizoctonia solani]|uniref:Uncharacterized protein n=1 Tax=Rhizoctonia solani TaxID=456999 RepID=A0A8H3E0H3_9AGAM|nr:unnamed protein product [Rhizoctonia solani]
MMQAPQSRPNNAFKAPLSPPNVKAYIPPIRILRNMNYGVSFAIGLWDDVTWLCSLEVVLHIYLVLFMLHNAIPELPPGAPYRVPAFPRHFPRRTHETRLAWDVLSILPRALQNTHAQFGHPRGFVATPDFIALAQLQSRLEYVIEESTRSSLVTVDMEDLDMALEDLDTLVMYSSLSNKDILRQDLRSFIEDAKATGDGLQQFCDQIWGAVGRIVHENNHAITVLLEIAEGSHADNFHRQKKMKDLWVQATVLLEKILCESIVKAQGSIISLELLEKKLDNIQDMIDAGEDRLRSEEQGVSSIPPAFQKLEITRVYHLETKFKRRWFPDEKESGPYTASFKLLLIVQKRCELALGHMRGMQSRLEEMSRGLSGLRATTTLPNVDIPIEKIKAVTERLDYGQASMTKTVDAYRREKFADQPILTNLIEYW